MHLLAFQARGVEADVVEQALAVVERADAGTLDPVDLTVPVRRTLGS